MKMYEQCRWIHSIHTHNIVLAVLVYKVLCLVLFMETFTDVGRYNIGRSFDSSDINNLFGRQFDPLHEVLNWTHNGEVMPACLPVSMSKTTDWNMVLVGSTPKFSHEYDFDSFWINIILTLSVCLKMVHHKKLTYEVKYDSH